MGIVCCAISRLVSHVMYYGEKFAACCACASMISCIMVTIMITLSLGIGLGYNYCFVDLKTRHRYQPPVYRHAPEHAVNLYTFGHSVVSTTRTPTFSTPKYGYPGEKRVTKYPGDKGWYQNTLFHKKSTPWWKAVRFTDLPPHMHPNLRRVQSIRNKNKKDYEFEPKLPNLIKNITVPLNDTEVIGTTVAKDNEEISSDYNVITSEKIADILSTALRNTTISLLKFIGPGASGHIKEKMLNAE